VLVSTAALDLFWAFSGLSRKVYTVWVKPDPSGWSTARGTRFGPKRCNFLWKWGRQRFEGFVPACMSDLGCQGPSESPPYLLGNLSYRCVHPVVPQGRRNITEFSEKKGIFFRTYLKSLSQRHLQRRRLRPPGAHRCGGSESPPPPNKAGRSGQDLPAQSRDQPIWSQILARQRELGPRTWTFDVGGCKTPLGS
jgi:hypothetical protein